MQVHTSEQTFFQFLILGKSRFPPKKHQLQVFACIIMQSGLNFKPRPGPMPALVKLPNPNWSNWRPAVQWYFPLWWLSSTWLHYCSKLRYRRQSVCLIWVVSQPSENQSGLFLSKICFSVSFATKCSFLCSTSSGTRTSENRAQPGGTIVAPKRFQP